MHSTQIFKETFFLTENQLGPKKADPQACPRDTWKITGNVSTYNTLIQTKNNVKMGLLQQSQRPFKQLQRQNQQLLLSLGHVKIIHSAISLMNTEEPLVKLRPGEHVKNGPVKHLISKT